MSATTTRPPRSAPPPPPASNGSAVAPATPTRDMTIRKAGSEAGPPRIVLNAVEGFGKTTTGAYAPKPIFLQAKGETGLETLRQHNLVPDVDTFPVIETWPEALAAIDYLIANDRGFETLVLDAMGGFERLCHTHVCNRDFKGEWGEKGFGAYQKGYELAVNDWIILLERIDRLRAARKVTTLILSHCIVRTFKNPTGPDFDRYTADCHEKTWGATRKWADAMLFGNFFTVAVQEKKNSPFKGIGGRDRIWYTENSDAYVAKNRYGMPAEIEVPSDRKESWNVIHQAIYGKEGE